MHYCTGFYERPVRADRSECISHLIHKHFPKMRAPFEKNVYLSLTDGKYRLPSDRRRREEGGDSFSTVRSSFTADWRFASFRRKTVKIDRNILLWVVGYWIAVGYSKRAPCTSMWGACN
jgi:hypothetical protein